MAKIINNRNGIYKTIIFISAVMDWPPWRNCNDVPFERWFPFTSPSHSLISCSNIFPLPEISLWRLFVIKHIVAYLSPPLFFFYIYAFYIHFTLMYLNLVLLESCNISPGNIYHAILCSLLFFHLFQLHWHWQVHCDLCFIVWGPILTLWTIFRNFCSLRLMGSPSSHSPLLHLVDASGAPEDASRQTFLL